MRILLFPSLILYGLIVNPYTGKGGIPCLWRFIFGIECPACGLSRAIALLVRGNFCHAVEMNVLIIPVCVIAIYLLGAEITKYYHLRRNLWHS